MSLSIILYDCQFKIFTIYTDNLLCGQHKRKIKLTKGLNLYEELVS